MSSASPAFSIVLRHAKHFFEAQAVQLQIKNQAIFSSGPASLCSWCHSQLPLLHCLRFKCNLLPRLCLSLLLGLLSQGIIPPFLLSITGFGSGHHCPPPLSVQWYHMANCCSISSCILRSQTKTKLYPAAGFVLPCKGKFHCWHTGILWLIFFPLLYQVWFKL